LWSKISKSNPAAQERVTLFTKQFAMRNLLSESPNKWFEAPLARSPGAAPG